MLPVTDINFTGLITIAKRKQSTQNPARTINVVCRPYNSKYILYEIFTFVLLTKYCLFLEEPIRLIF